jgi:hypothetical protein
MPDPFNANIRETIEQCRRLASATHDRDVARTLRELADKLEAGLPRSNGGTQSNDA